MQPKKSFNVSNVCILLFIISVAVVFGVKGRSTQVANANSSSMPYSVTLSSVTKGGVANPTPILVPTATATPTSGIPLPSARIVNTVLDESNNTYVSGVYQGNKTDFFVARLNSAGMLQWLYTTSGPNYDWTTKNSLVYYAGRVYALWWDDPFGIGSADIYLSIFNKENGIELWKEKIISPGIGVALNVNDDGVYVAVLGGVSNLMKYIETAPNVWTKVWTLGIAVGPIADIATDNAGYIYLTGNCCLPQDIFIYKYDKNKNMVWTRGWGTPTMDFAEDISVVSDGILVSGKVISGLTPGEPAFTYDFLLKYTFDGTFLWMQKLN